MVPQRSPPGTAGSSEKTTILIAVSISIIIITILITEGGTAEAEPSSGISNHRGSRRPSIRSYPLGAEQEEEEEEEEESPEAAGAGERSLVRTRECPDGP